MSQEHAVSVNRIAFLHFCKGDLVRLRDIHRRHHAGHYLRALCKIVNCNCDVIFAADPDAKPFLHYFLPCIGNPYPLLFTFTSNPIKMPYLLFNLAVS